VRFANSSEAVPFRATKAFVRTNLYKIHLLNEVLIRRRRRTLTSQPNR
jgi:hypothetical protein